jgi:sec-independent protein translocase protein TatA
MLGLRMPELLLILAVLTLLFGATKLPQLGKSLGEALHGFRKAVSRVGEEPAGSVRAAFAEGSPGVTGGMHDDLEHAADVARPAPAERRA